MGSDIFTVPATDVPAPHVFGGWVNTLVIDNLAIPARFITVRFDSGEAVRVYGQRQLIIGPADTSLDGMSQKIMANACTIAGDAVGTQLVQMIWTCKNPANAPQLVQV